MTAARTPRRWLAGLALLAWALVAVLYWPSLHFDLYADDFVFLRPWLPEAWWRSLTGTWLEIPDAPGFYRPVATTYYALAFYVFGLNAPALHALPLLVVPLCGWLAGVYVWRETRLPSAALIATVLYVIHPATTVSVGPWIANQYHGFATICVLVTLILWQRCRERPLRAWAPLLVPIVIAGFIKEDALMLPLVLVVAQWAIARWTGTVAPPPRTVVMAALALFATLNLWRVLMLGGPGGYWWPDVIDLAMNAVRGPIYILLIQLRAPVWAQVASVASVVCLIAAVRTAIHARAEPLTRVAIVGLVLLVLANVPLILMTSRERGYLLTLAAVLMLTTGLHAIAMWFHRRQGAAAAALACIAVAITLAATSANRLRMFGPCSRETRTEDQWIAQDMVRYLAPELGPWIRNRMQSCDPATYRPLVETLPVATWSHAGGATMMVRERARAVAIQIRVTGATSIEMTVSVNGRPRPAVAVDSGDWVEVTVPLEASWLTPLRRMHRVDIRTGSHDGVEFRSGAITY